ncbi:type VI secretion system protein TssR domain-containing protein [Flavobacterium branchiophilum]|uniref:Uncharacterized protein n=1 Tax=Flavobacterium branchiophilum TaxID=55197 RepID=A0A2H3KYD2_9FLAO|nr:type VI secretion system protein TssR domain-containing protein [Flavobacterium branchiophilum]PDS26408.1 hypothetical protein B0A77_02525 [Flavobacterium branchiophilum]
MTNNLSNKPLFFLLLFSVTAFSQIKSGTGIVKEKAINTYNEQKPKEKLKKTPKTVFSDRDNNDTYQEPYSAKMNSKIGIGKAMYVIDENENYYEVVVANEKLLGKPKGIFAFLKSKKYHFANTKEVNYLGWIKKDNVIEFSEPQQNQENLKYVKYLVASNNLENLYHSEKTIAKNEVILKSNPNLEIASKSKINLNDFVYVYKINTTHKSAFVSNFDNLVAKDTINQKRGWISLEYITPLEDHVVLKLEPNDTLKCSSKNELFVGNQLFKNTLFVNENQTSTTLNFEKTNQLLFPINVWNHEKNKITNLKGDDILMSTIAQIEEQSKTINLFYIFDNDSNNKQQLKKLLASIQNLKISIEKEAFSSYDFTFSFIAKGRKSYYLLKSKSFSKWFDLIEKSIKSPNEIPTENTLENNNSINQFLSDEATFENNFFIVVGANNAINSLLPDDVNKLTKNSTKLLFVTLENKNTPEIQDFILQNKAYLNLASSQSKKFIQNYYVDQKLLIENDEFAFSDEFDNSYIFDAPKKSNFNGGIVFPKLDNEINPKSVNTAIDSILVKTIKTNHLHLKSLRDYRSEFSFLRSIPSHKLNELLKNVAVKDAISNEIPKNYKNEIFLYKATDTISPALENRLCLLMNKEEIKTLIENYRELVVKDYTQENITKEIIKNFRKKAEIFVKNQNATTKVKYKNTLADLFFNKTGVFVNSLKLHETTIKDVKKLKEKPEDFRSLFMELNQKLEILEAMQREDTFELFNEDAAVKYYYVPKHLLL